ncbi:unnamed protein product [Amoebophrya sp. A25]|nr:unnamed protein product [Amoebophrya sp. A25]|eukprot:GSA25T00010387001.1
MLRERELRDIEAALEDTKQRIATHESDLQQRELLTEHSRRRRVGLLVSHVAGGGGEGRETTRDSRFSARATRMTTQNQRSGADASSTKLEDPRLTRRTTRAARSRRTSRFFGSSFRGFSYAFGRGGADDDLHEYDGEDEDLFSDESDYESEAIAQILREEDAALGGSMSSEMLAVSSYGYCWLCLTHTVRRWLCCLCCPCCSRRERSGSRDSFASEDESYQMRGMFNDSSSYRSHRNFRKGLVQSPSSLAAFRSRAASRPRRRNPFSSDGDTTDTGFHNSRSTSRTRTASSKNLSMRPTSSRATGGSRSTRSISSSFRASSQRTFSSRRVSSSTRRTTAVFGSSSSSGFPVQRSLEDPANVLNLLQHRRRNRIRLFWLREVPKRVDWWIVPLQHGFSEGFYRAMTEISGNLLITVVFIANFLHKLSLGTSRQKANGILEGFIFGIRGLVLDSLVTPTVRLVAWTRTSLHDYGRSVALLSFTFALLRIPLGPVFGVLHLVAAVCEGLASALLQEEAQFAQFEPQRSVEGINSSGFGYFPPPHLQEDEDRKESREKGRK